MTAAGLTLAMLFVHPLTLPEGARLWMLLPLVACVASVYRATRVRSADEMLKQTVFTFFNILVGMTAIALAFYGLHQLARYYF